MKPAEQPIGVFDSGVGGLTVVREMMVQLPGEKIVYFGDSARSPYGNKSPENLVRFAIENGRFLVRRNIKMLVVACNSSSAYSLPALRKELKIPVLGVVEPGARAAAGRRLNQKIGVIGTHATINSHTYQNAILNLAPDSQVFTQACPLFVPLVEEGWLEHPVTEQIAAEYLTPLKKAGVASIVLGCTHYPLIKSIIQKVVGPELVLVDSAMEKAREVKDILTTLNLLSSRRRVPATQHQFFVSDMPEKFSETARQFLGRRLANARKIGPRDLIGIERRVNP